MRAALVLALAIGLLAPGGLHAAERSPAAVVALAARATHDARALEELRVTTSVDGRAVDLAAALDVRGADLRARLAALGAVVAREPRPAGAATPVAAARAILGQRRFRGTAVPQPLHRPLAWLGGELRRFSHWLGGLYRAIAGHLPGGAPTFWSIVCAALAAAAAFVVLRLGRRRAGRLIETRTRATQDARADPGRLERDADRAEREGDFGLALRLRFRAGLLRLAAAEAIPARAQLTNGEIARRLASTSFRGVAHDFDEVVYGGRGASGEDARRAAEGWSRVLDEVPRR